MTMVGQMRTNAQFKQSRRETYLNEVATLGNHAGRCTRALELVQEYRGCLWPHGHPSEDDIWFCGAPKAVAESYCPEHLVQARAPQRTRTA